MTEHGHYSVIPGIDATHSGPVRIDDNELVHLTQGDADGACGPYCLFMCLLILGIGDRADVTLWGPHDRRTSFGKLFSRMNEGWSSLFREGTDLQDLSAVVDGLFRTSLRSERFEGSGKVCRHFVIEQVRLGRPVILGIKGSGLAHWVVVIGLDVDPKVSECSDVLRFLILDPGQPASSVCPWNGIIDARACKGSYPYTWWTAGDGGDTRVGFDTAIAFWRV